MMSLTCTLAMLAIKVGRAIFGPQLWLIAFLTGRWLRNIGWCLFFCAI
jgi:hypothetical protein